MCVCVPTIGDQCPAGQHSPQHELGHSQQGAHEAAYQRHAVEEIILNRETGDEKQSDPCVLKHLHTYRMTQSVLVSSAVNNTFMLDLERHPEVI